MSVRLVSSAKNLREQYKSPPPNQYGHLNSSNASVFTSSSGISHSRTLELPALGGLSRQGSLLRSSSSGNLRRAKSMQKKTLISKVFTDEPEHDDTLPELSMEMTLLIVKRCIKEIRERGLTTKGILRQVHMALSHKVISDTIRIVLDDDASTALSALGKLDIHLVAHCMKWAIRYSEETLVTYADYQALYLDQDRNFTRFVHDLPPTNRAILLDLFSLCADVTLLAHLNNMTLVAVAKAISLCIMAEPEREFTTFDASLQQRNLWGGACEDLLRAFLRIKTSYDLAKIEHEDEVDENRYVDNVTRVVKSARQRSNDGNMAHPMDVSMPSSAGSSLAMTPNGNRTGYFDHMTATPRSASPLSRQPSLALQGSLSRSHSLARSNSVLGRPASPATYYDDDALEYEEIMQDRSHLTRLRQQGSQLSLRPAEMQRRRSSVADMESLYMLPAEAMASTDGYESDPETAHASLIPDFADGLGWDFSKHIDFDSTEKPSLVSFESLPEKGILRSNSASSNGSGAGLHDPRQASPRTMRDLSKQSLISSRLRQLQEQHQQERPPSALRRAHSQYEKRPSGPSDVHSPPQGSFLQRSSTAARSPPSAFNPRLSARNPALRRSISLDPHTMHGRIHKKPDELSTDIMARELALQTERFLVEENIRNQLLQVKNAEHQDPARASSEFSLERSPMDLDRPVLTPRRPTSPPPRPNSPPPPISPRNPRRPAGAHRSRSRSPEPIDPSLSSILDSLPALDRILDLSLTPGSNPRRMYSAPLVLESDRKFEVVSRPKEIEVSVQFSPTPISPTLPRAEVRSKFYESFPERPISPPPGYLLGQGSGGQGQASGHAIQRSPTAASTKSNQSNGSSTATIITKMSPATSALASPGQSLQRNPQRAMTSPNQYGYTKNRPTPLQQGASFSGVSSATTMVDQKSKTPGFIRALSSRLRSKQSDDQLKPVRINDQVVGAVVAPPLLVSIQPPRLELSFMDEFAADTGVDSLAPASAPATMLHGEGANPLENWRQSSFGPLSAAVMGDKQEVEEEEVVKEELMTITKTTPRISAPGSDTDRPKGLTGGRRSSAAGAMSRHPPIHTSSRDQRRQFRKGSVSNSPSSSPQATYSSKKNLNLHGRKTTDQTHSSERNSSASAAVHRGGSVSDSSFTTDDSTLAVEGQASDEKEYRFTTATLLKDGKLYYQLQWDQFSEIGFKSDFFHDPDQSLSEIKLKAQLSGEEARVGEEGGVERTAGQEEETGSKNSLNLTWDLPPGQQQRPLGQGQDPGPSPAQRAAAMKAAREGVMALAKDPKAMAALKAGSANHGGQATIIGSGTFQKGSTKPQIRSPLLTQNRNPYPSPNQSPSGSLRSSSIDESDNPPKNSSDMSSRTSSATERASLAGSAMTAPTAPGLAVAGGGGPGSLSSWSSVPVADNGKKATKKSGNRLFGKKSKKNSGAERPMNNANGRRRILPVGVRRQDVMTKTEESLDEVFPWMCIEHMAGQDSGWVMLEPVQDGAVGWVKIDILEDEAAHAPSPPAADSTAHNRPLSPAQDQPQMQASLPVA